jgi:undecaprenyl-phosphate 4-deoxy-4-formamido-L-arabinose transferase
MDDDLQHPPSEIKKLLEKLAEGYDVVYGAALEKQHTTGRNLGSFLIRSILSTILGAETARYASAFRAFRTPLRNAFANYNNPNVVIDVLLSWGAMQLTHVFVEHHARAAGSSRYTLRKLIQHATLMLTGFSTLPLHLASVIGFGLTLVGVLLLIYLIPIRYLILGYEGEVPGFTFLACVITIFAGVQMFAIGIIGEYLAGLHFRMMDRPAYVIDSTTQLHTHNQQVGTSSHE